MFAMTGRAGLLSEGGTLAATKARRLLAVAISVALLGAIAPASAFGSGTITTLAGSTAGFFGFTGDGGPATSATLHSPVGVAVDAEGNVYIADTLNYRVRKVNAAGTISTFAGIGTAGSSGDGGPATSAQVDPAGLAVDGRGNLYIAEFHGSKVREVHEGIIKTIAGTGGLGFSGDNGPATSAMLRNPAAVAVDGEGNVFIADEGNLRVRDVHEGIIKTIAGDGSGFFSGDGGPATSAGLTPESVAVDAKGNLFIADIDNARVREVHEGIIKTIAGTGTPGFSGDGGPATSAELVEPDGIAVDQEDNVYITTNNCRLRKISSGGTITTLAGTEVCGFSGDGCLASLAQLDGATGGGLWDLALDEQGNIYVAEYSGSRVREIRPLAEPEPRCMTSPAEEAASKKRHEEEAAAKKHQEEEAAAKKHQEEEAAAKKHHEEEAAASGNISLDGLTIIVQRNHEALIKLTCTGTATCSGKLTLTAKKSKKGKTKNIGTAAFSIPPGKIETIKLKLNGTGWAFLSAAHGRLSASLTILKTFPSPSKTQSHLVHLVKQKTTKGKG